MDLAAIPWGAGSLVVVTLSVVFSVCAMVYKGLLEPRSHVEDVRADRDARLAEANEDAEQWRQLYVSECQAHEMTRQAHAQEIAAALTAATEGAQIAAALLTEIRAKQIEAQP